MVDDATMQRAIVAARKRAWDEQKRAQARKAPQYEPYDATLPFDGSNLPADPEGGKAFLNYFPGYRAGVAIGTAAGDPSLGNITNAGVETGMAAFRPGAALAALLGGYGVAAARDSGLLDMGATAAGEGTPGIDALDPASRKRLEQLQKQGKLSRAEREEKNILLGIVADAQRRENEARTAASSEKTAADQKEYASAVEKAEAELASGKSRVKRFSDSEVGKVMAVTGGWNPVLAGMAMGGLSRFVTGGGSPLYNYVIPGLEGAAAGFTTANVPLVSDMMFTDADNPARGAYEAYARELPPTHPRKQEWQDYARGLPEKNPVRQAASDEFYGNFWKRSGAAAAEGVLGGLGGALTARLPEALAATPRRLYDAARGSKQLSSPTAREGSSGNQKALPPPDPGRAGATGAPRPPGDTGDGVLPDVGARTRRQSQDAPAYGDAEKAASREYVESLLARKGKRFPSQDQLLRELAEWHKSRNLKPRGLPDRVEQTYPIIKAARKESPENQKRILDSVLGRSGFLSVPAAASLWDFPDETAAAERGLFY